MCSSLSQGKHTLHPQSRKQELYAGMSTSPDCQGPDRKLSLFSRAEEGWWRGGGGAVNLVSLTLTLWDLVQLGSMGPETLYIVNSVKSVCGLSLVIYSRCPQALQASLLPVASLPAPSESHPVEAGPVEATALSGSSGNTCGAFLFAPSLEIMCKMAHVHQQARHEQTPHTHIRNAVAE